MRAVMIFAVVAALGWGGYWFAGARALDHAVGEVLEQSPELSASSHDILGFPSRFDVTLNSPRLSARGVEWSAPFVQVFALSYRLNHIIAVFAHDQQLRLGGVETLIHSDDMRASVEMTAGLDLPLEQAVLTGEALDIRIDGLSHQIAGLRAALRPQAQADAPIYETALVMSDVFPAAMILDRIDPSDALPRHFDTLRLDAELETSAPLDRHAMTGAPVRITRATLTGGRMAFEGGNIVANGRVTPDQLGRLNGDLSMTITGWTSLIDRLVAAGYIPADQAGMLHIMAQGLTQPDAPETVVLELGLRNGLVSLGPLPLFELPPLN